MLPVMVRCALELCTLKALKFGALRASVAPAGDTSRGPASEAQSVLLYLLLDFAQLLTSGAVHITNTSWYWARYENYIYAIYSFYIGLANVILNLQA